MRTQQYIQVEAIVAKYETLAANTDLVKKTQKECNETPDFYLPDDICRLQFGDQLIARIYQLRAGKNVDPNVKEQYSEASSYYIKGLLNEEEEQYLVDNFYEFVDYAFEHFNTSLEFSWTYNIPQEWSRLVPHMLENKSGKIFILNSDDGREFVGLDNCDLTVAYGYEQAAIRALACGLNIHPYKYQAIEEPFMHDCSDGQFNAVIADIHGSETYILSLGLNIQKLLEEYLRIVKEGGDLLLCVSKAVVLHSALE